MAGRIIYNLHLPTRSTPFRLWFVGDVHLGAQGCEVQRFKETIEQIRQDKHAYWIGMGDYCDFISFRDPRFDPLVLSSETRVGDLRDLALQQMGAFVKLVKPVADKGIVLLTGNHETSWINHYHYDVGWYLADNLGIPCKGENCFIRLKIFDKSKKTARFHIDIYAIHGWGGTRTEGAELNKLEGQVRDKLVDIIAMGHGHKLIANAYPRIVSVEEGGELKQQERPQMLLLTGSYLKTYLQNATSYSERRGYRAVKLGSPVVQICLRHRSNSDEYSDTYFEMQATI